jgi:hypothetical protein
VAFLAAVGLLLWNRGGDTPDPKPIVVTQPDPVKPPDPPVTPPKQPDPVVTRPPDPTPTTPDPIPLPSNPETPKPPDTGKTVAQPENPKPRPPRQGSVAGASEMLDNIGRFERDLKARIAGGEKIAGSSVAFKQLDAMRTQARKAKNAEDLEEIQQTLNFLEKNLLKRK